MAKESGPIEAKVTTGTTAAGITSFVMGWLVLSVGLPESLSEPVSAMVLAVVTSALTFAVAWFTKHTNRLDPAARRGKYATGTGTEHGTGV